jgi:hypothetical protein
MFTVWITDEGKKVGEKLPEPLLIKNVNDMYVAEFIQGVMYQEWKPDVYNWAQRDASVPKLKKEPGEEVRRRKTLSDYKDEGNENTMSFILEPPAIATHAIGGAGVPSAADEASIGTCRM